jgi:hypothetical protein
VQLVGRGVREWRDGKADTKIGNIIERVESLKEDIPIDEVETLSSGCPEIRNDQVNVVRRATNSGVESTRPELSVSRKLVGHLEVHGLESQSLSRNNHRRNLHH